MSAAVSSARGPRRDPWPTIDRREWLARGVAVAALLASAGLLPSTAQAAWSRAVFEAKSLADVVKALGASAPVASKELSLGGPDSAENGAVVPVALTSSLAGIRRMLLLIEKNPNMLSADFELSDSVEADFKLNVKMAQTSNLYLVALLGDGRVLYTTREIKVTLGACGN